MTDTKPVIVGSRGSLLALSQTQQVVDSLKLLWPQVAFTIRALKTLGDRDQNASLARIGGQGVFVKDLEKALLAGKIDMALHSLKDVPGQLSEGLELAAFPKREDARDALIAGSAKSLANLPVGARLGTGSPRRISQLKAFRSDLRFTDLRGNLDTRIRRVEAGDFDGIILAVAGLKRLGWQERITERLSPEVCTPMVGQGALAIEIRADDERMREILSPVDDWLTRCAVTAERAFLQRLGGGCQLPMAAHATMDGEVLKIIGMLANNNGEQIQRVEIIARASSPAEVGEALAETLLAAVEGKHPGEVK